MFTDQTLQLFAQLISGVTVNPTSDNADATYQKVAQARDELKAVIAERNAALAAAPDVVDMADRVPTSKSKR